MNNKSELIKEFSDKGGLYILLLCVFAAIKIALIVLFTWTVIPLDVFVLCLVVTLTVEVVTAYFMVYNPLVWVERHLEMFILGYMDMPSAPTRRQKRFLKLISEVQKRIKYLTESEYKTEILRREAEINALQSQINPHFLYNTLEAIRGYALAKEVNEISDMTEALSSLFRYSIKQQGKAVTIADELENVKCYLTIQQYRFPGKIHYHASVDTSEFDLMQYYVPNLTIQPIIENALHHGIEAKVGEGNVWLDIFATDTRLVIRVKDDGVGIKTERLREISKALRDGQSDILQEGHNGMGLAMININKRLKMQFGEKYGITLISSYGVGTEVEITLPLNISE